ncbi:Hypothetical predicted protein [Podarcis lilfordi]|uniref:Uncharacterized protein n=1 Tax=Podarcis lilfordi TaxID=74358 RepID=A0AA35PJX1_9SAUR|nr:Hypothetical predicted protein [Podarcis lilfordi]
MQGKGCLDLLEHRGSFKILLTFGTLSKDRIAYKNILKKQKIGLGRQLWQDLAQEAADWREDKFWELVSCGMKYVKLTHDTIIPAWKGLNTTASFLAIIQGSQIRPV